MAQMDQDQVEVTARTVEEAIELALKQLDVERDEVEIEVVSKGKAGILGFGAELSRVRVSLLKDIPLLATEAKEVVDQLLARMGLSLASHLRNVPEEEPEVPRVDIDGDDSGLLIGRRGETLRAFQFLVNYILSHQRGERAFVALDVEQYRERRSQALQALATRLAERVAATGRPFTLEPMPPTERRIVHMALADHPKVATQSSGEEGNRSVTILPGGS